MLTAYLNFNKYIALFLFSVCAVLGFVTFGNPLLFDRVFLVILFFIAVFNLRDIETLGITLIITSGRIAEELFFLSVALPQSKILTFVGCLFIIKLCWYDSKAKYFAFPILLLCVISEMYWYFTDYSGPLIHFYVGILGLNLLVRHLFFLRIPLTKRLTSYESHSVQLDWQLYSLTAIHIFLTVFIILEYLARHLSNLNPLLIYESYPVVAHCLNILCLFLISNHITHAKIKFRA